MRNITILTLIGILLAGCGETDCPVDARPGFVVLLGDSHTLQRKWTRTVMDALAPTRVEVHAWGGLRSGDWIPSGGLWNSSDFENDTPTSIVILLGTNDSGAAVPWQTYEENIQSIVDRFIFLGADQIILVPPPSGVAPLVKQYGDALFSMCDFDLRDEIECGPDLLDELVHPVDFSSDAIHLSAIGDARVAELLIPLLLMY